MPEGTCRLCLKTAQLQDSHHLPKATYRLASKLGRGNASPIFTDGKTALETSLQLRKDLLCPTCEGLFSKRGETWIMKHCRRSDHEFRLREAFGKYQPPEIKTIATARNRLVDGDALAYFAASMFWRAAVTEWRAPTRGHAVAKLDLGPYEQALRLYLTEQADFPERVALIVFVGSLTAKMANGIMIPPGLSSAEASHSRYSFAIPGIRFDLVTGSAVPPDVRGTLHRACAREPYSYVSGRRPRDGAGHSRARRKGQAGESA